MDLILIRKEKNGHRHRKEGHVRMGAETGVIAHKLGKAEDCQPPPEVRKEEGKDSALAFSEGMRP